MSGWEADGSDKPFYIRWFLTQYCNYRCSYCFQSHSKDAKYIDIKLKNVFKKPSLLSDYLKYYKRSSAHSFKNFPPARWSKAFEALSPRKTAVTISGGEPFLDRLNFRELLLSLTHMDHIDSIRIDTNGTWKPDQFQGVNWRKLFLNVSYHPAMVSLDRFVTSIEDKLRHGINVTMVNYVMAPTQLEQYLEVKEVMGRLGVFVNANVYYGPLSQTQIGYEMYKKFIPGIDIKLKTKEMVTSGELCLYPVFAYELNPTGMINVGCFPNKKGDFIKGKLPERFNIDIPCPATNCGCLDMYAFLKKVGRARKMNLLEEYVEECKLYREGSNTYNKNS